MDIEKTARIERQIYEMIRAEQCTGIEGLKISMTLLTLICDGAASKGNKLAVYDKVIDLLLDTRQRLKAHFEEIE